jgi:thymidylate kinase
MRSASRQTCVNPLQHSANTLFATLNSLLRGVDGRVILLRPLPQSFDHQRDDIDVLMSDTQRQQLLRAAFTQCLQKELHCRIEQASPSKMCLTLWTADASQKLMIDLWTDFDQLPLCRHHRIPADRLLNVLTESADSRITTYPQIPALHHLPPDIDLCLLIQHLAKKRKVLDIPGTRHRIASACDRMRGWSPEPDVQYLPQQLFHRLQSITDRLPLAAVITPDLVAISHDYLLARLANVPGNRGLQILERRKRRRLLTDVRNVLLHRRPTIAFIGSDGAGKSSVVSALAEIRPAVTPVVAKKFYRRSLIYQFCSGFAKRLFGTNRDRFDSFATIPIAFRALMAAWVHAMFRSNRQTLIFDRSVASFLIADRKTDLPRTSSAATWIEPLTPPVTNVLLALPHSELIYRKNEMSALGHETYQRLLFEQALRQQPTDIILLASLESVDATAVVAAELLWSDSRPIEVSREISPIRKAAA